MENSVNKSTLEQRLRGSYRSHYVREFFTNSAYFPLVNIFLELLLNEPLDYLLELDLYIILFAALVQTWFMSRWQYRERPKPFVGNLIAPAIYTVMEVLLEGGEFFATANHLAYWCFALSIGTAQHLRLVMSEKYSSPLILLENLLRTSILLVMYIILEFIIDDYSSLAVFLDSATHLFVVFTIPFIGILIGFANINTERYLAIVKETAEQLKIYSQWFLGKELLEQAVTDPQVLTLSRHERAMVFMDIRGFTAWSEAQEPETVVAVMNAYYEAAEPVWREHNAIKVKFTADEIMLVFAEIKSAVTAAGEMLTAVMPMLRERGLTAGVGVHSGAVVEGVMGASDYKGYDLLGDSVNTAKRLCDNALGGEILLSQAIIDHLGAVPEGGKVRSLSVKGKQLPLSVTAINI